MSDWWNPIDDAESVASAEIGLDGQILKTGVSAASDTVRDAVSTSANQIRDVAAGYGHAAGDLTSAGGAAAHDYAHGWSRAFNDVTDGDPLGAVKAPLDVLGGELTATGRLVEGAGKATNDVLSGGLHAAGDAFVGGTKLVGDVGSDVLHGLGFGGSSSSSIDKAIEKHLVGQENPKVLKANQAEEKAGKAQLQQLKGRLAANDPAAFGTADEILDPGSAGLHYFDYFLPAYNMWTGQHITVASIRQAYDRERGLSFAAFTADAKLLTAAAGQTRDITQTLQSAYNTLIPTWQGSAAAHFETTMAAFFTADQAVAKNLSDAGSAISAIVVAIQNLVYTKASTVSGLYLDRLPRGIDGVQALQAMVTVAQGHGHDPLRRWVLGTLGQPIHGRHAWDSDDMYSLDDLDDRSRQLATTVAGQWCNKILVAQTEQRLNSFFKLCDSTTSSIKQLFAQFAGEAKAVANPFAALPTAPGGASSGSTTPAGSSDPGVGGGTPAGSTPSTGAPSGSGSAPSGTGYVPIPNVGSGETQPTVPAGTAPGATTTPPASPGGSPSGGPSAADPIVTNPDGSVTFGPNGALTLGIRNPDGSFTLTDTDGTGTHRYRVAFAPDGHPVVEAIGSDAIDGTNGDDHATSHPVNFGPTSDLSIGAEHSGDGFTLTDRSGPTPHDYQVSYDSSGHPHVSAAAASTGDVSATTSTQMGVGTQFGAQQSEQTTAATALPGDTSTPTTTGTAHSGSTAMGMPMMGGMGRGAGGGGDQELRRKYGAPQDEGVVDADELEYWDRLGPTIG
ncbi:hypothetical protein SAMN05444157_3337 [Frankineae bacterium MT45]|nr:hypothetical protein SAMN05444157_3337 [Frankineae bacterium MT45]